MGETLSTRPGPAGLRVLGDGLGGGRGPAMDSLCSSALPPYWPRGTGGSLAPGALSGIRSESGRFFLICLRTTKILALIKARPPPTPTTAPAMTAVPGPLDFLDLPPWLEPSDPLLPELPSPPPLPLPFPLPAPLPVPLPLLPV